MAIVFVSIPLEQGSVLRQNSTRRLLATSLVSIPLEQGSVLRRKECIQNFSNYD